MNKMNGLNKMNGGANTPSTGTPVTASSSTSSPSTENSSTEDPSTEAPNQSIIKNMGIINSSINDIKEDVEADVEKASSEAIAIAESPVESVEKLIQALIMAPVVLEQIVEDKQFLIQVKVISLTLAQALSDSIQIMTPYMEQAFSTLVERLARTGFLAILDAAGTVPVFGEIIDAILIVNDAVITILNVTRATTQLTDISALLLTNLIRIYKQNYHKVEAANGRVTSSLAQFQNTNTETSTPSATQTSTQSGGKKKSKGKTRSKSRVRLHY